MKILFLHGWNSVVGGVKPTYLKAHGHEVPGENIFRSTQRSNRLQTVLGFPYRAGRSSQGTPVFRT